MEKSAETMAWLDKLTTDDCLAIIKYGLRNYDAPEDVTVEDIFMVIGCIFISGDFDY